MSRTKSIADENSLMTNDYSNNNTIFYTTKINNNQLDDTNFLNLNSIKSKKIISPWGSMPYPETQSTHD